MKNKEEGELLFEITWNDRMTERDGKLDVSYNSIDGMIPNVKFNVKKFIEKIIRNDGRLEKEEFLELIDFEDVHVDSVVIKNINKGEKENG